MTEETTGTPPLTQEQRLLEGQVFCPGAPQLRALKQRAHALCARFNTLEETDPAREELLAQLFAEWGEGSFIQGPLWVHYGCHTRIGQRFFGNFALTIMDDAPVTIGDDCSFGTGVTIVTALHPMLPGQRRALLTPQGRPERVCWARPVTVGSDCWFGANVTVCPGVIIGKGCVIGAGSVVTRDIPAGCFAAGVPCRVKRRLSAADSLRTQPQLLGGYTVRGDE